MILVTPALIYLLILALAGALVFFILMLSLESAQHRRTMRAFFLVCIGIAVCDGLFFAAASILANIVL